MLLDKLIVLRLIQLIKERPLLYDVEHHKNSDIKSAWHEIALELGASENALKRKWKNLKDCYRKHIRANSEEETNLHVKSYKRWAWSRQLKFLRPYVISSAEYIDETLCGDYNSTDTYDIKVETDPLDAASNSDETEEVTPRERKRGRASSVKIEQEPKDEQRLDYAKTIKKLPVNKQICVNDKIKKVTPRDRKRKGSSSVNISEQEPKNEQDLDATEHIFLGYAKTIKNLPIKNQIYVKMKIAKLIMQQELKCLE